MSKLCSYTLDALPASLYLGASFTESYYYFPSIKLNTYVSSSAYVPFLRHYMHCYDLSFGQDGLPGSLIRPFCIMLLYRYLLHYGLLLHIMSNTYAYSLLFYKVYMKRENASSWDSGLEKEQILETYSAQLQKF